MVRNVNVQHKRMPQYNVIDIFDHMDPDAEIIGPNLSDSCSNSDESEASGNAGGDNSGNVGVVVVTTRKKMIMKTGLSGMKIINIFI